MSALPPGDLIPGPQMMGVGFSLVGMAFADNQAELSEFIQKFEELANSVRASFASLRGVVGELEKAVAEADATSLRALLDRLLETEKSLCEADETLVRLLGKKRFTATLNKYGLASRGTGIRQFSQETSGEFIPFIRDIRLRTICAIAERASAAGIKVMEASEDFRAAFRSAELNETEGWQETASHSRKRRNCTKLICFHKFRVDG